MKYDFTTIYKIAYDAIDMLKMRADYIESNVKLLSQASEMMEEDEAMREVCISCIKRIYDMTCTSRLEKAGREIAEAYLDIKE